MDNSSSVVCDFCQRPKHSALECWVNPSSPNFTVDKLRPLAQVGQPPKTENDIICDWCQRANHCDKDCVFNPQSNRFDLNELKKLARTRLQKGKVFCSLCHRPAHTLSECFFNPKSPNYDPTQKNPRLGPRKYKNNRQHQSQERMASAATTV